ncbi:hypothetical protein CMEL01_11649 [Colletotrichum melonis]|uniref:Uncharacterized protein n=1 Tax=Colletotrichum melonis TaxID=1209925 RepID=A0AAI9XYM8_9PEZI|nr:hypothetical protein CMEL01_11649 [Colletotrichum melonis]
MAEPYYVQDHRTTGPQERLTKEMGPGQAKLGENERGWMDDGGPEGALSPFLLPLPRCHSRIPSLKHQHVRYPCLPSLTYQYSYTITWYSVRIPHGLRGRHLTYGYRGPCPMPMVDPSARLSTYPITFFRPRLHCCIHTLPPLVRSSLCLFLFFPPYPSPSSTHPRPLICLPSPLLTCLPTYRYLTPWTLGYRHHHHHHRHHNHEHQQPPPQTYVQRLQRWLERCHAFRQYVLRYTWLERSRLVLAYLHLRMRATAYHGHMGCQHVVHVLCPGVRAWVSYTSSICKVLERSKSISTGRSIILFNVCITYLTVYSIRTHTYSPGSLLASFLSQIQCSLFPTLCRFHTPPSSLSSIPSISSQSYSSSTLSRCLSSSWLGLCPF